MTAPRRGPLAGSYPAAVALVVCSLIPYLALTAAVLPLAHVIAKSIGLAPTTLDLTVAVSAAAYTLGTVVAVQLAVHLPARRLLVLYELCFVVASCLTAWSPSGAVFVVGFVAQGLFTSLMLIAAVPPLVTRWPARKMPLTGMIMNLCIFGAVAVGPTLGAAQLTGSGWRALFWGVATVAVLAFLLSLLTFDDDPAQDPSAPWDLTALALAVAGSVAAFVGAGRLEATMRADASSLGPLVGGVALILLLVVHEYRRDNPLMPVRAAATSMPVTGIFIALTSSAAGFGVMELVLQMLRTSSTPADTALLFLPEFVGAIFVAGLFGLLFRTRFTPVLALAGLLAITAAAALFLAVAPSGDQLVAVGAGLLGVGVGASVSPALFMAGFSMRSVLLQRVFALIELLRGVTAFLVAPVLIFLAGVLAATAAGGIEAALWVCLGVAAFGFVGGSFLYLTGRRGLESPDIERWQAEGEAAWDSPPLLHRPRSAARALKDGRPAARSTAPSRDRAA